jgi:site-specific recombinase XerD
MGRPKKITGTELVAEFVERSKKRLAPLSIEGYQRDILQFLHYLTKEKVEPLQATEKNVRRFLEVIDVSQRSANRKLAALRAFYGFLFKEGRVSIDPTVDIKPFKVPERLYPCLSREEVKKVFEAADRAGIMWGFLFHLLYYTGMRRQEGIEINLKAFDLERRTVHVIGKGNKERVVRFPPAFLPMLDSYQKEYRSQWPSSLPLLLTAQGRPLTANRVEWAFRKVEKACGIEVYPHILRHSFCTHALQCDKFRS